MTPASSPHPHHFTPAPASAPTAFTAPVLPASPSASPSASTSAGRAPAVSADRSPGYAAAAVIRASLAGAGVQSGELTLTGIPPSRSLFATDHDQVFVKVIADRPGGIDHEYGVASHLANHGFPTPAPLAAPLSVSFADALHIGGVARTSATVLAYRHHPASPAPVTSSEIGTLAGTLWTVQAPDGARVDNWRSLFDRSLVNIAHVRDQAAADQLLLLARQGVARIETILARDGAPQAVFSHGDLHYRNALRAADGTAMLIDWEWAGLWWPEMEAAKFVQTALGEPTDDADGYHNDTDAGSFLVQAQAALGRPLNLDLIDACVRLRAANACSYQHRWNVLADKPHWYEACFELAAHGYLRR